MVQYLGHNNILLLSCVAYADSPLMNESQLNCGRPPEWIGVQITLELAEAEHACTNKYRKHRSVIFGEALTQDSYLISNTGEKSKKVCVFMFSWLMLPMLIVFGLVFKCWNSFLLAVITKYSCALIWMSVWLVCNDIQYCAKFYSPTFLYIFLPRSGILSSLRWS